jgi:hypothetical protein
MTVKSMKTPQTQEWNCQEAARLAAEAYRYVGRTFGRYPPEAALESLGKVERAVLEAQERGDWPAYVEALRELCRTARREAQRRAAA